MADGGVGDSRDIVEVEMLRPLQVTLWRSMLEPEAILSRDEVASLRM